MHKAPRRHILAKSLGTANVVDTGIHLSAPRTFVYIVPIESQCYAAGLVFGNCFSKSMHVVGASIASISSDQVFAEGGLNAGREVFIGPHDIGPVTQIYFDNNGVAGTPATDMPNFRGQKTSITLPGSANNTKGAATPYTLVCSDLSPLTSVPRTDGGKQHLLFILVTISEWLIRGTNAHLLFFNSDPVALRNRRTFSGSACLDGVDLSTDPTGGGAGWKFDNNGPVLGIRYLSAAPGVQIAITGDSLTASPTTDVYSNPIQRAAWDLSSSHLPIEVFNLAGGGAHRQNYTDMLLLNMPILKPSIVGMQPLSRNDGLGPSGKDLDFLLANMLAVADIFRTRYGTHTIFNNPGCLPSFDPQFDGADFLVAAFRSLRAQCIRIAEQTGIPLIDGPACIGQPEAPWLYRDGSSDDNCHPNSIGAELVVPQAIAALSSLI